MDDTAHAFVAKPVWERLRVVASMVESEKGPACAMTIHGWALHDMLNDLAEDIESKS